MPTDAFAIPTLTGRTSRLRPPEPGELLDLAGRLADDPESSMWWGNDAATIERWFDDPEFHVLVVETAEGAVAGVIAFEEENDPDYRSAGIDIGLLTASTGRGVGTDALVTLARWLVDVRGHHRLTIDPATTNERAIHVYRKIGFRPIGTARKSERGSDGTWHDNLLMDLLAEEIED